MGPSVINNNNNRFYFPSDEIPIDCDDVTMTRILGATTKLRWFSLLCGYLRKDLVCAQQLHYTNIDSMKSGSKWVSTLIVKLWNILHSLWCHRCGHLHDSQAIHDLNGLELLREVVIAEYTRGHGTLPMVYRPYFSNPLQILLSKPPNSIKNWFRFVVLFYSCLLMFHTSKFIYQGPRQQQQEEEVVVLGVLLKRMVLEEALVVTRRSRMC